jgi:hypothetical protein
MRFCKVCGENLRKADGSCISSVPLFSETVNKEFCSALGVQSVVLANLLSKLGIVLNTASQQDDHFACKKCSRKIVNCYKLFSELYKSFGYSTLEENLRSRSLERSPTDLEFAKHSIVTSLNILERSRFDSPYIQSFYLLLTNLLEWTDHDNCSCLSIPCMVVSQLIRI